MNSTKSLSRSSTIISATRKQSPRRRRRLRNKERRVNGVLFPARPTAADALIQHSRLSALLPSSCVQPTQRQSIGPGERATTLHWLTNVYPPQNARKERVRPEDP